MQLCEKVFDWDSKTFATFVGRRSGRSRKVGTISGREMKGDVSQVRKGETRFFKESLPNSLNKQKHFQTDLQVVLLQSRCYYALQLQGRQPYLCARENPAKGHGYPSISPQKITDKIFRDFPSHRVYRLSAVLNMRKSKYFISSRSLEFIVY